MSLGMALLSCLFGLNSSLVHRRRTFTFIPFRTGVHSPNTCFFFARAEPPYVFPGTQRTLTKDDIIESLYHALLNHSLVTRVFSVEMDLPGGTFYTKWTCFLFFLFSLFHASCYCLTYCKGYNGRFSQNPFKLLRKFTEFLVIREIH